MNRIVGVARIHAMDRNMVLLMPWGILSLALAINVIFWALLPEAASSGTGGILSLYIYLVAMVAQQVSRGFPFQVGFGVTRRHFLAGTLLLMLCLSLADSVILTGLNLLEGATDGFGLGGRFFRVPWITDVPDWQLFAIYALPMAFFVGVGMLLSAIWSRYRLIGMVAMSMAPALAGLCAVAVITWSDSWASVGNWFADLQPLTAVGSAGVLGVAAIVGSWLTLRRAPV